MPPYEGRSRLRVLGGWPGILATYGEPGRADDVALALRSAGFTAWVMPGAPAETRVHVRRFAIQDACLRVEAEPGTSWEAPLHDVRLLLHGTRWELKTEHVLETGRGSGSSGVSAAGVLLGMSGPLATSPRAETQRREERESFVHVYAAGLPTLVFRASALQYVALRDTPVEPTRVANFARVVAELRERFSHARFDDRLVSRVAQLRLLGPTLRPELHLDVAIALLTRDLCERSDPYR